MEDQKYKDLLSELLTIKGLLSVLNDPIELQKNTAITNIAASLSSVSGIPFLPGRRSRASDAVLSSGAFPNRICYYKNLTITGTVTALAGGTIAVVEDKFTITASGIVDANSLGAKGGAGTTGAGAGGYGGGISGAVQSGTRVGPFAINTGGLSWQPPVWSGWLANGGTGAVALGAAGQAGGAFPYQSSTTLLGQPSGWQLILLSLELMAYRGNDDSTSGGIGGGGGSSGAGGSTASGTSIAGGFMGFSGTTAASTADSGGGGSGVGGGGAGGGGNTTGGTGGAGGRGGGVFIAICREFLNLGTVRANGANGSAASGTNAGGGGGGGGGVAVIAYEISTATGTVTANGGSGGAKAGTGGDGGAGGAGAAAAVQVTA